MRMENRFVRIFRKLSKGAHTMVDVHIFLQDRDFVNLFSKMFKKISVDVSLGIEVQG